MAADGEAMRPWLLRVALISAPLALYVFAADQADFLRGALSRGQVVGRDFITWWAGSRLLLDGRIFDLYDHAAYMRALAEFWGPGLAAHSFPYPPSIFPLIVWTGALPYGLALALWSAGGVLALLAAAWPYSRRPATAAAILVSPAVLICLDIGQNGLLTAALLIGGLRLADRRPWLAGALIGLVAFKPQMVLLVPVALIAAGRWRLVAGAAASCLALAAAGTLMTGAQAWSDYIEGSLAFQRALLLDGAGMWRSMTPSPLAAALGAGLPRGAAYVVQAAFSLACAALVFVHFRRLRLAGRRLEGLDILILMAAGFLAAPYSFNYDMACVTLALVLVAIERPELDARPAWRWGVLALWTAPALMMLLTARLAWLPAGVMLMSAGLVLAWLGSRGPAAAARPIAVQGE